MGSTTTEEDAVEVMKGVPGAYRISVRQFKCMIDAGVFPEDTRVELVGGILVRKMTKNDPHNFSIDILGEAFDGLLPQGWIAREEKSIQLGRWSRPEPDIAIVRGPRQLYRAGAPWAHQIALLIEVSDSSYAYDRGDKWRRYAAAKIPAYWIVNVPLRRIEVYGDPAGKGRAAAYQTATIYDDKAEVPVVVEGVELGRIVVRDILP